MNAHSEWQGAAELGIVTHAGREYAALGSSITPAYATGYLERREGALVIASWDGSRVLGSARITSTWRTPRSYVSSTMSQVVATIDGRRYTGRCAGLLMVWHGKATRG